MFVKDKKLDDLIWRYRKDEFYANYDKEDDYQNKFTKKALNFVLDLTDCDSLLFRYNKKIVLWPNLEFFNPGIKGMIAFFYAIDKGYNTLNNLTIKKQSDIRCTDSDMYIDVYFNNEVGEENNIIITLDNIIS